MRKAGILLTIIFFSIICNAQIDSIYQRIFLLGDAGEMHGSTHPVIDWLKKNVDWNDEKNVIIFLGDNVYPLGLPMEGEPGYAQAKRMIDYELSIIKGKKARGFFVPGNHDWKNGKLGGWQQIMNQEDYVNGLGQKNIQAFPTGGCPGPVAVDLSPKVVVVFIDSQWFLYVHEKPGPGSSCDARTIDEFAIELQEIVAAHPNQLLIIAQHHPIHSYGIHGGDYTWKEHIFPFTAVNPNLYIPLPVLGSIYPIARGVFGSLQDFKHPLYQTMANTIDQIIKKHPNPMQVAGHDHSLQLIMNDSIPYIISGSGTYVSRVKQDASKKLLFGDTENGFAMLEIRKSGNVEVKYFTASSDNLSDPVYTHPLKKIDTLPTKISRDSIPVFPDSVLVAANPKLEAGGLKELLMGKNYRQEWTTPIKVPVLDLGKEEGGLTPVKQGGGKETRTLRVEDKNGKEWALRTVQKFPDAAIPPDLRQSVVKDLVEDGISASYPYAALSVNPMASAEKVPSLQRKLVYIPDDPRLGRYRPVFKNTLATMEEREPDSVAKTYNTDEVALRLAKDNDNHIDQVEVLRARLLDNFYMDFDRHEGQWRWATRDTGKGKIYYAIPNDPDEVLYTNQGLFPKYIKNAWLVPQLQGFSAKASNIKTFNKQAANFDRFFLNEIDEQTWSKQVDTFLMRMTDQVINEALMRQPREVRGFHTQKIINTLKERKKIFKSEMMKYYRFISRQVNIVGTNQRELFTIDKNNDGSVHVVVNKISKKDEISSKIYDRIFYSTVTKEIRIYGLEDADSFVVRGGISPILIRIIGGSGNDAFVHEGTATNVMIYDVNFERNRFYGDSTKFINRISGDPQSNMFNRDFYKYNYYSPGVNLAYNIDDGLFIGLKTDIITQGFRKEPYATRHYLSVNHAIKTSSYSFRYEGDITNAIGNNDIAIRGSLNAPVNVTNFFGYGNNTVFNKSLGENYYRARYNISNASVFVRRQLQSWMRVGIGPTFQYFHMKESENLGKFVSNTRVNGLDSSSLYDRKYYGGLEAILDINSKNHPVIPSRGFVLDAGARTLFGLNNVSKNVTQLHWDMRVFTSFEEKAIVVYALRFGYALTIGSFELPQAQYLSGTDNLRGYRRNRFAGRSVLYQNTEVRVKLVDFNAYLFPGSLGVLFFNDVGKVWLANVNSATWHDGYGGGVWVSPIKRFVITASVAHSAEESLLPYVSFGFQF